MINWKKIEVEYVTFNPPDFLTHLNYVSCMCALSTGITLSCNLNIRNQLNLSKKLQKKINLMKLTLESINGEYKVIKKSPDYAELCVAWISVKSYYLIFNLLLILNYLINASDSSLNSKHKTILAWFKTELRNNVFSFNNPLINVVYPCSVVRNTKFRPGDNLKIRGFTIDDRCRQILKKLVEYKIEDLKREANISNFRKKKDQKIRDDFINVSDANIFEFFYWYRIKANYRDLEFLDSDIEESEFQIYYDNYFNLTVNFYKAFKQLINKLALIRFNREILS